MKEQEQKKTKKGGFVIGIVAAVIIVALIGVIIFLLLSRNAEPEVEKRNVVVTPENVESVLQENKKNQEQKTVAPGRYIVTMNPTWHFATGSESSYDGAVVNVEANTNDVYFDIVLASDEEIVLYKSPVIPRGGRLEDIVLDEPLEAGSYDCVMIYHLIDEEQNTLSTVRVALNIIVEG